MSWRVQDSERSVEINPAYKMNGHKATRVQNFAL